MPNPAGAVADCDFCAIVDTRAPAEIVCEDQQWIAFFPLNPATPGHTLVVPRTHVPDLWQADTALAHALIGAVQRIGHAIDEALRPAGMNLITSAGRSAEQTVFHLHLHVVPRWESDTFGDIWPPERHYRDETIDNIAERIRRACQEPGGEG